MFITKTMNESTDLDIQGFDLIDSICESYEDLLNLMKHWLISISKNKN